MRKFLYLLGLVCAAWVTVVTWVDRYGLVDRAEPAEVIVVLGSRVWRSGRPGPALARRAAHAAALYGQGLAPVVICSGGLGPYPPTEARAACDRAQALGVPASAVVLEEAARSTEESAIYVAAIMRERGWTRVIVVSDGYHLYRAQLMFSREGVQAFPSPAQGTGGPMRPLERAVRANREVVALAWYWLKTWLGLPVTDFDSLWAD